MLPTVNQTVRRRILASPEIAALLAWPFDLRFEWHDAPCPWFRFEPEIPFVVVAADGGGGLFVEVESGGVWFVSSEGAAGPIAECLEELVGLVVALPYFRDLVAFAGRGLEAMALRADVLEAELRADNPGLEDARRCVLLGLSLPVLAEPVAILLRRLTRSRAELSVLAPDGWPCEPLVRLA